MADTDEKAAPRSQYQLQPLLVRYHRVGDLWAREQAIQRSMPLAKRLAYRYYRHREPLDDLVQVAYVGLVKAVDRFDPDRGVSFVSFATPTILGELRRHFRDSTWALHVPRGLHDAAMAVDRARERLGRRTGGAASPEQLAVATGLSVDRVAEAVRARAMADTMSLEASPDDETPSLADRLGSEDSGYDLVEDRAMLGDAFGRLTERERRVLTLRFADEMTQAQIACRVGVSQMQVSRLLRDALDTLSQQLC
jgi:RNA polymerase sigma-B factor